MMGYEEEASIPVTLDTREVRLVILGYSTTFEACPIHSLYDACADLHNFPIALTQLGWSMIMQQSVSLLLEKFETDSYVRARVACPAKYVVPLRKLDKNGSSWCIKMAD